MDKAERLKLVLRLRNELSENVPWEDQNLALKTFEIGSLPETDYDPGLGDILVAADDSNLLALADYLGVEVPSAPVAAEPELDATRIDAYAELVAAETALRDVVRASLGDRWRDDFNADQISALESRRNEEDKRRDGITVSQDLLDYTETYHLKSMLNKHWSDVKPILDDKARAAVYLDILLDVRNTIAHSRPVMPPERLLLAGAARQIQNQLAKYRSSRNGPGDHYASINSAKDSMGTDGHEYIGLPIRRGDPGSPVPVIPRLNVGDTIEFELSGSDPRGRDLNWRGWHRDGSGFFSISNATADFESRGNVVVFKWVVSEFEVGENHVVVFALANTGKYHLIDGRDDARQFTYHVNPPLDS